MRQTILRKTNDEPRCINKMRHSWQPLGKEDNGETVDRCGNCLTLRYEKDGTVRYEVPER